MRNNSLKLISTKLLLAFIIMAQISVISSALLIPKPVQAGLFGIPDFNIKIGDIYTTLKDIGLGALRSVALNASNKFLTEFTNKLQEKYKIRNFLYYDQVLTDYYLNQYISDKISDPDLRQAYGLLQSAYVTGQSTSLPGQPDPRKAIIPKLKAAMTKIYLNQGGIDPSKIYNPSPNVTDQEYFAAAQAYFSNPPSFTEENIRGQFGAFQSSATTASQLEITIGNGLKAGRIIGGTCSTNGVKDPVACQQAGGTWNQSAVDAARSFIDNPTGTVDHYLSSAILTKIDGNFNPNNFWAVIGSLVGNFLFNQLTLDKSGGTLNDAGPAYASENVGQQQGVPIDFDGDGITDGYDINGDAQSDICIYGGAPTANADGTTTANPGPPCLGSSSALTVTPPPPPEAPPAPGASPGGQITTQTLTLVVNGSGSVSDGTNVCNANLSPCKLNYTQDQSVTLTATNGAQAFAGWAGDCISAAAATTCTQSMLSDRNVTANFQ